MFRSSWGLLLLVSTSAFGVVQPTFTSKTTLSASQAVQYTYTVTATTADHESITFHLAKAPSGVTFSGGNTVVWTPTAAQSRIANTFSITATSASGGIATQSFKITPTGTISGTRIGHFKTTLEPVDLSTTTVRAYLRNSLGGYNTIAGSGTKSGTFKIPKVPGGFYLLQIGNRYLWTKNSLVNADFKVDMRPNTIQADPSTTITFNVSNLNAWQSTDFIEFVSMNTGTWENSFYASLASTTLSGTFPYYDGLNDASKGDQAYILQMITQPLAGLNFNALGRFLKPPLFTQVSGGNTTISGTFMTVPQNQTFPVNINGADFYSEVLKSNPNAVFADTYLALDVYPGTTANGYGLLTPDLVWYYSQLPISNNGDLGKIFYGNPFPSTWGLYIAYQYEATISYTAPGASTPAPVNARLVGNTNILPTETAPIKLLVSVVNSPSINGSNFFGNHSGLGLTPTLKWSLPTVGTSSQYRVDVHELTNNLGSTRDRTIARLYTPSTTIKIPPGLLSSGRAYVFVITSYYLPGINVTKSPFMGGSTVATADVASGLMQP